MPLCGKRTVWLRPVPPTPTQTPSPGLTGWLADILTGPATAAELQSVVRSLRPVLEAGMSCTVWEDVHE